MTSATRPLALVTGASSGIGFELARQLGERSHDLVVCAEDAELEAARLSLLTTGADVTAVTADLSTAEGVERLWAAVRSAGRPLEVACLNAGVGRGGRFVDNDLADELEVIELNITRTVHLAKLVLREMVARDSGRVLFTSSVASTQPGTFHAVYNGSKSFVQSFAEALQEELQDSAVTVTSLMPGPTDTEFFERADLQDSALGQGPKDDPEQVARQGLDALFEGKRKVVGGSLATRAMAATSAVLPDAVKAKAHGLMAQGGEEG